MLNYNREHYGVVSAYSRLRERVRDDCKNDPLFRQLPVFSVARKVAELKRLPTGLEDNNDKKFEEIICHVLPSMFYPHLDFAKEQARTDSGVLIRDLIFFNTRTLPFLTDIYNGYGTQQIVFELKNVKAVERDHVNQLNRYLSDAFGRFGVLVTRKPLPKPIFKNLIDLWSGQRRCIIALDDSDLEMMSNVFQSKQRNPIEVVNKKLVEFIRACPS